MGDYVLLRAGIFLSAARGYDTSMAFIPSHGIFRAGIILDGQSPPQSTNTRWTAAVNGASFRLILKTGVEEILQV